MKPLRIALVMLFTLSIAKGITCEIGFYEDAESGNCESKIFIVIV